MTEATLPATLLLTRPRAAAERFRDELATAGVTLPTVISPMLDIVPLPTGQVPDGSGLIFTSENGVTASGVTDARAFVVGRRAAEAARRAGLKVDLVAEDSEDLVARLKAAPPNLPLLHLRGAHARGDIARRLGATDRVVYRQDRVPLSGAARALLEGNGPLILPLFSPRSAKLLADQAGRPVAPCRIVALSAAVAAAWPYSGDPLVALEKTGAGMIAAIKLATRG